MSATALFPGTHPRCSPDRLRALSTLTTRGHTHDLALAMRHFEVARRRGELVELARSHAELLGTLVTLGDDDTAFEARLLELSTAPSEASWNALCQLLDTRAPDDARWPRWLELLERALAHWPDGLRKLPNAWLQRLRSAPDAPHHHLRLLRRLSVHRMSLSLHHLLHHALSGCTHLKIHAPGWQGARWLETLCVASCARRLDTLLLVDVRRWSSGRRASAPTPGEARRALPRLRDVSVVNCGANIVEEVVGLLDTIELERLYVVASRRGETTAAARVLSRRASALQRIPQLDLGYCLGNLEARTLLDGLGPIESPDILVLSDGRAPASMLGALSRLVSTRHARVLDLSNNQVDARALRQLFEGSPLPRLQRMSLGSNRVGNRALTLLAEHIPTRMPALRTLDLRDNLLGADGLEALLRSRAADQLEHVDLGPASAITDAVRQRWSRLQRSRRLVRRAARLGMTVALAEPPPRSGARR